MSFFISTPAAGVITAPIISNNCCRLFAGSSLAYFALAVRLVDDLVDEATVIDILRFCDKK